MTKKIEELKKESKTENTIWHNIVYSTKGGCGKTTFSLNFQNLQLADYPDMYTDYERLDNTQTNNIVLDFDLLASNMFELINSSSSPYKISGDPKVEKIIDYIFGVKKFNGYRPDSFQFPYYNRTMVICGPRDEKERSLFKTRRRYVPSVRYEEFKYSFTYFIKSIIDTLSVCKNTTYNIVYDLPPNSDGYTEILFEQIFSDKSKLIKNEKNNIKEKTRLFILTNPEETISRVNEQWLEDFFTQSGSNLFPEEVYYLFNKGVKTGISPTKSAKIYSLEKIASDKKICFYCCEFDEINISSPNVVLRMVNK